MMASAKRKHKQVVDQADLNVGEGSARRRRKGEIASQPPKQIQWSRRNTSGAGGAVAGVGGATTSKSPIGAWVRVGARLMSFSWATTFQKRHTPVYIEVAQETNPKTKEKLYQKDKGHLYVQQTKAMRKSLPYVVVIGSEKEHIYLKNDRFKHGIRTITFSVKGIKHPDFTDPMNADRPTWITAACYLVTLRTEDLYADMEFHVSTHHNGRQVHEFEFIEEGGSSLLSELAAAGSLAFPAFVPTAASIAASTSSAAQLTPAMLQSLSSSPLSIPVFSMPSLSGSLPSLNPQTTSSIAALSPLLQATPSPPTLLTLLSTLTSTLAQMPTTPTPTATPIATPIPMSSQSPRKPPVPGAKSLASTIINRSASLRASREASNNETKPQPEEDEGSGSSEDEKGADESDSEHEVEQLGFKATTTPADEKDDDSIASISSGEDEDEDEEDSPSSGSSAEDD